MTQRQTFRQSHHAERALHLPRPKWRGRSHQVAALATVPLGTWLTVTATPGTARIACLVLALGTFVMFAASSLYHWRRWSPHVTEVLLRVDHTGIYVVIAATATAFALLGLPDPAAQITVLVAWVAVAFGVMVEWLPFASPKGLNNGIYLGLGWGSVVTLPLFWSHNGVLPVALLLLGGLLYTVGVVVVARQRPDPNPDVFGYHEIWHLFVIAAVTVHWVDVGFFLR